MAFNPQQIYPIDLNASKAVGVDIPFNGPAVFKSNYLTQDAIKNNLINFFLTNPGDVYLNPSFGGGLRSFIFEQINNNIISDLKNDVSTKLVNNFPNVSVISLDVLKDENTNNITVNLKYQIINTNISDNLEIQF